MVPPRPPTTTPPELDVIVMLPRELLPLLMVAPVFKTKSPAVMLIAAPVATVEIESAAVRANVPLLVMLILPDADEEIFPTVNVDAVLLNDTPPLVVDALKPDTVFGPANVAPVVADTARLLPFTKLPDPSVTVPVCVVRLTVPLDESSTPLLNEILPPPPAAQEPVAEQTVMPPAAVIFCPSTTAPVESSVRVPLPLTLSAAVLVVRAPDFITTLPPPVCVTPVNVRALASVKAMPLEEVSLAE